MLRSKSFSSMMRAVRGKKVKADETDNMVDAIEDQEDEVDRELLELGERVKKWLQESRPPASTFATTDDDLQHEKISTETNMQISKHRRHSMQETRVRPQTCSILEDKSCTILYHPDFADWKACDSENQAVGPVDQKNSPTVFNLLEGAHTSLSKLFNM
jgi:hypothetical protein